MLSIIDSSCRAARGGVTRRELLRVGAFSLAGAVSAGAWPGFAGAAGERNVGSQRGNQVQTNKSVVLLFLQGGPPQMETFDPKLDLPENTRSCMGEIPTCLPGVWFGGTFPQLAQRADRLAVVRTYSSGEGDHQQSVALAGGTPFKATMGAAVARGKGSLNPRTGVPNHVLVIPDTIPAACSTWPTTTPAANTTTTR